MDYETGALVQKGMEPADVPPALAAARDELDRAAELSHEPLEQSLRAVAAGAELKPRQFFGLLRVAVTGREVSPPLFETMEVLGKERVLSRIDAAIGRFQAASPARLLTRPRAPSTEINAIRTNPRISTTPPPGPPGDFVRSIVAEDLKTGARGGRVITRFPPEPNGYLHIGHAKSTCLNFGLALENGGVCHLRLDDSNPTTEDLEYVQSIQEDVRWLGWDWGDHLYYASDYFDQLYEYAVQLIKSGKAYVCSLGPDEIREYRGTLTEPGRNSPYRDRTD